VRAGEDVWEKCQDPLKTGLAEECPFFSFPIAGITTAFTFYNEEEYVQSLERLDGLFARYAFKGLNPFASRHVKQTPHDADLMWASNRYLVVLKVKVEAFMPAIFPPIEKSSTLQ